MQKQKWRSASFSKINRFTLVTGAGGFVGSALCEKLLSMGSLVKGTVRSQKKLSFFPAGVVVVQTGEIDGDTSWKVALSDVDVVIHLAGVAHKVNKRLKDDFPEYRRVNVIGTECLARACARAGVRRFIFLSSIGVNGEFTFKRSFSENDIPYPVGAYAISKYEAEQALRRVASDSGMEIVILRPPLVYGPNAPGNFSRFMSLIEREIPLPLGKINNLRSFLYLGNLTDAIVACINHPLAAGETFLVSDGQDVSTLEFMKMIASSMGKNPAFFFLHPIILKILTKIIGKADELEKLTGSLLVDSNKIRNLLDWKPPFSLEEGIKETVKNLKH